MHIIDNWKYVLSRTYSVWSMILGFIAFMGSEALYAAFGIEADPYPLGRAALVFFIAGFLGRFIKQDEGSKALRRTIFLTAFGFGIFMLIKSLGGAVYEDVILPEDPAAISADEQAFLIIPAMSEIPGAVPVASGLASNAEFLAVAVPFVGKWEGLRLAAYRDIVGVWTVCYGETKGVRPGDRYTKAECDAMLARELISYRSRLHRYFSSETLASRLHVQRDTAYTSLAYNVGVGGAGKSTATRRLNAGDIAGGCKAITWWNKAGGRVVRGLALRRGEDYGLCMIGVA
jgi:lysozyme